jgi:hypothetical protein
MTVDRLNSSRITLGFMCTKKDSMCSESYLHIEYVNRLVQLTELKMHYKYHIGEYGNEYDAHARRLVARILEIEQEISDAT